MVDRSAGRLHIDERRRYGDKLLTLTAAYIRRIKQDPKWIPVAHQRSKGIKWRRGQ